MPVSVIIITRNSELTLAATFDCLIVQTDAAWQALIVDNASADRTAEIMEADSRFLTLINDALNSAPDAVAASCNYCRVLPDGTQATPRTTPKLAEQPFEAFARTCRSLTQDVQQTLTDARVVIARGFTCENKPENRNLSSSRHESGIGLRRTAFAYPSLWRAAFDGERGRKSLPPPAILRDLPRSADRAADIRGDFNLQEFAGCLESTK